MTWQSFNQSWAGKAIIVLFVLVFALLSLPHLERFRDEAIARTPLPGDGPGDPCAIWFIGSSTMHRWEGLPQDMAPWKTVKRGVDGATFPQLTERFALDPARTPPRAIVLYAGENDIAAGTTVPQALANLRSFLAVKAQKFDAVPIFLISIKPSPTRWNYRPQQLAYNAAVRDIAAASRDETYVEIGDLLMDGDKPGDYYQSDGIHLRPEGYRLWVPRLKAALGDRLGTPDCTG